MKSHLNLQDKCPKVLMEKYWKQQLSANHDEIIAPLVTKLLPDLAGLNEKYKLLFSDVISEDACFDFCKLKKLFTIWREGKEPELLQRHLRSIKAKIGDKRIISQASPQWCQILGTTIRVADEFERSVSNKIEKNIEVLKRLYYRLF